jgi:hypothetical protein
LQHQAVTAGTLSLRNINAFKDTERRALDRAGCHDIYQNKFIQDIGSNRYGQFILIFLNGLNCCKVILGYIYKI